MLVAIVHRNTIYFQQIKRQLPPFRLLDWTLFLSSKMMRFKIDLPIRQESALDVISILFLGNCSDFAIIKIYY